MNTIASNLANYESYKQTGEPFRKLEVVFQAIYNPERVRRGEIPVAVTRIRESDAPFRVVYDPGNPRADARGFVRLPNIDIAREMAVRGKPQRLQHDQGNGSQGNRAMEIEGVNFPSFENFLRERGKRIESAEDFARTLQEFLEWTFPSTGW